MHPETEENYRTLTRMAIREVDDAHGNLADRKALARNSKAVEDKVIEIMQGAIGELAPNDSGDLSEVANMMLACQIASQILNQVAGQIGDAIGAVMQPLPGLGGAPFTKH